jgi:Activator of Hsp90 ATPase homolog 1-like protein
VPNHKIVQSVQFESDDPRFAGEMIMTWLLTPGPEGTTAQITAEKVPEGISLALGSVERLIEARPSSLPPFVRPGFQSSERACDSSPAASNTCRLMRVDDRLATGELGDAPGIWYQYEGHAVC